MGLLTASQQRCRKTKNLSKGKVQEFQQRKNQKLFVHRIKFRIFRILSDAQNAAENSESSEVIKDGRGTKEIPKNRGQLCCKLNNKFPKPGLKIERIFK